MSTPWPLALALSLSGVGLTAVPDQAESRRVVEVWTGGCCGLDYRFRDQLETALKESPSFILGFGKKPGTLIVFVPKSLQTEPAGDRLKAPYFVEFTDVAGRRLGTSSGTCWDDDFGKCAAQVVKDAKRAARRLR